jgi:hypothetical protein
MPIFSEVGPDAKERLAKKSKGYQQRQAYRDMLGQVGGGRTFELRPEDGETIRRLKGNVRRSANELELQGIRYGETEDGALLVWCDTSQQRSTGRRGRPRKNQEVEESA